MIQYSQSPHFATTLYTQQFVHLHQYLVSSAFYFKKCQRFKLTTSNYHYTAVIYKNCKHLWLCIMADSWKVLVLVMVLTKILVYIIERDCLNDNTSAMGSSILLCASPCFAPATCKATHQISRECLYLNLIRQGNITDLMIQQFLPSE
jgi:hypothetical protein